MKEDSEIVAEVTEALKAKGIEPVSSEMEHTAPEYTEIEKAALDMGWNPKGPKSAEVWVANGPLLDEIKGKNKEVSELKATLNEIKVHMTKVEEAAYNRALAELKAERKHAIAKGDVSAVEDLDQQIEEHKASVPEPEPLAPEAMEFIERNKHWVEDYTLKGEKIREFAIKRDKELMKYKLPPEKHFAVLEADIEEEFHLSEKATPSVKVATGQHSVAGKNAKKDFAFNDLSAEQKTACRHFVKRGVMTEAQYIEQLKLTGDLK